MCLKWFSGSITKATQSNGSFAYKNGHFQFIMLLHHQYLNNAPDYLFLKTNAVSITSAEISVVFFQSFSYSTNDAINNFFDCFSNILPQKPESFAASHRLNKSLPRHSIESIPGFQLKHNRNFNFNLVRRCAFSINKLNFRTKWIIPSSILSQANRIWTAALQYHLTHRLHICSSAPIQQPSACCSYWADQLLIAAANGFFKNKWHLLSSLAIPCCSIKQRVSTFSYPLGTQTITLRFRCRSQ